MPDLFNPLDYPIIFIQPARIGLSAWLAQSSLANDAPV
jgi:hypothetical protein